MDAIKREVTGEHPGPLPDHVVSVFKTPHLSASKSYQILLKPSNESYKILES